jgi:hypothetical protein
MTREEFIARADWAWVRAGALEHRQTCEMRIAQVDAEVRAQCRPPRLREQEELAAMQENIQAAGELIVVVDQVLALLDRQGR